MDIPQTAEFTPSFDGVNSVANYFHQKNTFHYDSSEVIIRIGDVPQGVYFLESGYVKVYRLTESGEENIQFISKPAEIFPLIWIFSSQQPNMYYEALTDVTVRRTSKFEFVNFLKGNTTATFAVIQLLTQMITISNERIANLELTNSYSRIIYRLLFLARRFGHEASGKIAFDLPLTQKDIGNSINITRETASKELTTLAKKGIISCKSKAEIVINSIPKLENELLLHYERKSM